MRSCFETPVGENPDQPSRYVKQAQTDQIGRRNFEGDDRSGYGRVRPAPA